MDGLHVKMTRSDVGFFWKDFSSTRQTVFRKQPCKSGRINIFTPQILITSTLFPSPVLGH